MNAGKINWVFHNASTTTGNGDELKIRWDYQTVNIEITGTATSSTVVFEGKSLDNGAWYPISCVNLTTLDLATQTTGKNECWQVDLTGLISFRCRIHAINGGNLSIAGRTVG
jgi:hypothetical protein